MGKPIIATNWSGPTEFMAPDNAYPLRIDGLTEIKAGPFKVGLSPHLVFACVCGWVGVCLLDDGRTRT